MRRSNTKRLTALALSVATAMLLSYIEHLLPVFVPIPGVKIGLANIATVFVLYTMGALPAAVVSAVRVFLSALLFGNVLGLLYSASGAALALLGMVLLKKLGKFSAIGVSVAGGVLHNMAQIAAASLVMQTSALFVFYLPALLVSGTLAGIAVGIASGLITSRIKDKI